MAGPLKSALINYFAQLETTSQKWEEFVDSTKRPIRGLKNQSEQYRHVISKDVDNAEISKLKDVRVRLIFKISIGIEDEVSLILNDLRRLRNYIENLKTNLIRLERARSDVLLDEPSSKEVVDGTSRIPRLDRLMEWSLETWTFFSKVCVNVIESFKVLDYKNPNKVEDWAKSIERIRREQGRIKNILGFTQFLIQEPVK